MRAWIFAIGLAACHPPGPGTLVPAEQDVDDDDVPDGVDRCPDFDSLCWAGNSDDDGCPVSSPPRFHVGAGGELRRADRARLASIARAATTLQDGVDLIVVGHALPNEPPGPALARATTLALALEDLGAPLERLLARAAGPPPPGDPEPGALIDVTAIGCPGVAATAPSASR